MNFVCASAVAVMAVAGLVDQAWSATIPVTSYIYDVKPPSGSYPDSGPNTELTDGSYPAIGSSTAFTDPRWVGVQNTTDDGLPHPQITFTLDGQYNLNTFTVVYDVDQNPQIFAPDSVSVSYSNDPTSGFSAPVSLTGFVDENGPNGAITRSTTFNFPAGAAGQYVQLAFYNDREWTFLAEVSLDGAPVPEPASTGILAAGALALLARRRRPA